MRFLLKLVFYILAVIGAAHFLPGLRVDDNVTAAMAAVVLGLLNAILRPILVVLTIPLTVLTLGLFLLVINAAMVLLTDRLIVGFTVDGFWWALIFSLALSVVVSLLETITGAKRKR